MVTAFQVQSMAGCFPLEAHTSRWRASIKVTNFAHIVWKPGQIRAKVGEQEIKLSAQNN